MEPSAEMISAAVVAWTGHLQTNSPRREEERVVAKFGVDATVDLMPRVMALDEEFYRSAAHQIVGDLAAATQQAASEFRERHPEISDEAVDALAWCYSYDWR